MRGSQPALAFEFPGFELLLEGQPAPDAQSPAPTSAQSEFWGDLDDLSDEDSQNPSPEEPTSLPVDSGTSNSPQPSLPPQPTEGASQSAQSTAPPQGECTTAPHLQELPRDVLLGILRRLKLQEWAALAATHSSLRCIALCDELWTSEAGSHSWVNHAGRLGYNPSGSGSRAGGPPVGAPLDRGNSPVGIDQGEHPQRGDRVTGWKRGRNAEGLLRYEEELPLRGQRRPGVATEPCDRSRSRDADRRLSRYGTREGAAHSDGPDSRGGRCVAVSLPAFGIRLIPGADGAYPALNPDVTQGIGNDLDSALLVKDPASNTSMRKGSSDAVNLNGGTSVALPIAATHTSGGHCKVQSNSCPPVEALKRSFIVAPWLEGNPALAGALSAEGSGLVVLSAGSKRVGVEGGLEVTLAAAAGQQWLLAKGMVQVERVGRKFECLRATHDLLRVSLCSLWQDGGVPDVAAVKRQFLKLTRTSWTHTYEAVTAAFFHAADCVAWQIGVGLATRSREDVGPLAWQLVLGAWDAFRAWLGRVLDLCNLLSECISAEQAAEIMQRGRLDTPSLMHAGRAAFRSQVMLCYGIRRHLQSALLDIAEDSEYVPHITHSMHSTHVMPSMRSIRGVLEELDVQDDATQPAGTRTRRKFRRVFGLQPAPHELRLVGPLQVPPLG